MWNSFLYISLPCSSKQQLEMTNRAFSHDVTAAMLVFQNKEMAAMMVYQTSPPGFVCKYFLLFQYSNMAAGHVRENALFFKVLTTTWTHFFEPFSLSLFFKSVLTNLVIGYFAHITHHKQNGIIVRYLGRLIV